MCVPRGAVTNSAESFGSKCPQSLGGSPQGVSRVLHKKEILAKGAHPAPERCMKTASTSQNVDRLKKNPGTSRQTFRGRTLLNIMAQCKGKSVLPSSTFPLFLQAHGMAASCIADAQSNPTLHHATWAPISSESVDEAISLSLSRSVLLQRRLLDGHHKFLVLAFLLQHLLHLSLTVDHDDEISHLDSLVWVLQVPRNHRTCLLERPDLQDILLRVDLDINANLFVVIKTKFSIEVWRVCQLSLGCFFDLLDDFVHSLRRLLLLPFLSLQLA
mmetsp:Transcript_2296/g.6630  ORF Transcript_2296/g.6630 Transcript_2296/m.6630 type:complete len:272 (-) Transcript_2296:216-1031(-)